MVIKAIAQSLKQHLNNSGICINKNRNALIGRGARSRLDSCLKNHIHFWVEHHCRTRTHSPINHFHIFELACIALHCYALMCIQSYRLRIKTIHQDAVAVRDTAIVVANLVNHRVVL